MLFVKYKLVKDNFPENYSPDRMTNRLLTISIADLTDLAVMLTSMKILYLDQNYISDRIYDCIHDIKPFENLTKL